MEMIQMKFDDYNEDLDYGYNQYMQELNSKKQQFYIDNQKTINPELEKNMEELEFYIVENRIESGGSLINFPSDFHIVKEDLTRSIDIECYRFYEKDKHTLINLVEIYADSVYAAIEINDEVYRLMKEIQKFLLLF
jgi:hypothetical protein